MRYHGAGCSGCRACVPDELYFTLLLISTVQGVIGCLSNIIKIGRECSEADLKLQAQLSLNCMTDGPIIYN